MGTNKYFNSKNHVRNKYGDKTAMQILKEKLIFVSKDTETPKDYALACENIIKDIDAQLLEIEKQQIITAHREGQEFSLIEGLPDSDGYYFNTYGSKPVFPKDRDTGNMDTV